MADIPTCAGSPELQFVAGFKSLYDIEEEMNFIGYENEMAEALQGLVDVVHLPKQRLGGWTWQGQAVFQDEWDDIGVNKVGFMLENGYEDIEVTGQQIVPVEFFRLYLFHLLDKLKAAIEQGYASSFDRLKNLSFVNAGRINHSYNFGEVDRKLVGSLVLALEAEVLLVPNFEVQIINVELKQKLLNIWLETLAVLIAKWG